MSRSYAMQHIQIYEYFVLELNLPLEELRKLKNISLMRTVLGVINGKALDTKEALEVIEKAKVLSFSDFAKEELDTEIVEGETVLEQPQLTATADQVEEQEDYLKPKIIRCQDCSKARVEYHEAQICQCDGIFHLTNLDT